MTRASLSLKDAPPVITEKVPETPSPRFNEIEISFPANRYKYINRRGIRNADNIYCYIIAPIQIIFAMNEFMDELYKASLRKGDERGSFISIKDNLSEEKIWLNINPIFIDIWKGLGYATEPRQKVEQIDLLFDEFRDAFFQNFPVDFKEDIQGDATEAFIKIMEALEMELGDFFMGGKNGFYPFHHCSIVFYSCRGAR
jgi:hypothetical protein